MICVNSVYQGYFLEFHLQASGVSHRCKERLAVCVSCFWLTRRLVYPADALLSIWATWLMPKPRCDPSPASQQSWAPTLFFQACAFCESNQYSVSCVVVFVSVCLCSYAQHA